MKSAFVVPADDALEFGKGEGLAMVLEGGKEVVDRCPTLWVELKANDRWIVAQDEAEESAGSLVFSGHGRKESRRLAVCGWMVKRFRVTSKSDFMAFLPIQKQCFRNGNVKAPCQKDPRGILLAVRKFAPVFLGLLKGMIEHERSHGASPRAVDGMGRRIRRGRRGSFRMGGCSQGRL